MRRVLPANARPAATGEGSRLHCLWRIINIGWAVYFVAVFTVGRTEEYTQYTIWAGGLLVGVPTLVAMVAQRATVSRESWLLWVFAGWSLLGLPQVSNTASFGRYFSLVLELAVIVSLVSASIRQSRGLRVWYLAFCIVGVVNATAATMLDYMSDVLSGVAVERQGGIAGNPNALGLSVFLGVLGALVLAGAERRGWKMLLLLAVALLSIYGVLLSASRVALLAAALCVAGWPIICGTRRLRSPWLVAAMIALAWAGMEKGAGVILQESTMGRRVVALREGRDHSGEVREELVRAGLAVAARNPILGVGLGQFGTASGTGFYAHSEWVELLATTGLPGFAIYMSAMLSAGRRLRAGARDSTDQELEYFSNAGVLGLGVVLVTGLVSWPHFLTVHSMFLLGVIYGTAALVSDPGARAPRREGARRMPWATTRGVAV